MSTYHTSRSFYHMDSHHNENRISSRAQFHHITHIAVVLDTSIEYSHDDMNMLSNLEKGLLIKYPGINIERIQNDTIPCKNIPAIIILFKNTAISKWLFSYRHVFILDGYSTYIENIEAKKRIWNSITSILL